jgi:hypothetical protein
MALCGVIDCDENRRWPIWPGADEVDADRIKGLEFGGVGGNPLPQTRSSILASSTAFAQILGTDLSLNHCLSSSTSACSLPRLR